MIKSNMCRSFIADSNYMKKVAVIAATGSVPVVLPIPGVDSGGVRPLQDEAMRYAGLTSKFFKTGDCVKPGNILDCNREAFAAASQI